MANLSRELGGLRNKWLISDKERFGQTRYPTLPLHRNRSRLSHVHFRLVGRSVNSTRRPTSSIRLSVYQRRISRSARRRLLYWIAGERVLSKGLRLSTKILGNSLRRQAQFLIALLVSYDTFPGIAVIMPSKTSSV